MQPTYKVTRITNEQVDPAYLLVSPVAPNLNLDGWRTFCTEVLARKRHPVDLDDIIVAVNPIGYIQGLCVYAARWDTFHGQILDVPVFVIASAADEIGVAIDLLRLLKARAERESCGFIRVWTLGEDNWSRHLREHETDHSEHGVLIILDPNASFHANSRRRSPEEGFPVKT